MPNNPYVHLCLSVQALRRDLEGVRSPIATAMGLAASLYTHQLTNVNRILTDTRVRHLLADEVGLGKTIQALMVLNALRSQRTGLQALVVVPDRLVPQWRDEIMTRAHTTPFGEHKGAESEQYIRLAWEAQLRTTDADGKEMFALTDIDPRRFDVLIIDELPRLSLALQDRIVRVAASFDHVLLLTATPAFQHVSRHAQLFALLEPERTARAKWRVANSDRGRAEQLAVNDDLSKWPEWAIGTIINEFLDRDHAAASTADEYTLPTTALTHCAYRRVIRTRRVDFRGALPIRRHIPIVVEPLGAEADRQSFMWQYFGYLDQLSRQFDPVLLAKRVVLSPPSLEQRVDFLRRKGYERAGLLERVKPLVHRTQGDSRADALIDLLADIWTEDPMERVLVAAQDNLTVDYLFNLVRARLPIIGPIANRIPLIAARMRQGMMTEAVETLAAVANDTNENLELFQRGKAQVLFAPEAAQIGLNLQCARILILYSVPWRPEEVEQWIGRLDRIGNAAAFSNDGEANTVDVYTIVQRGLVDEKVVTVLKRFNVFERSVNLDGEHLEQVASLIEDAALHPNRAKWRELEDTAELMATEDTLQELDSTLRQHLPWKVSRAFSERKRLDSMPPVPPVISSLSEHSALGPRAWDRAFEGMLKLLKRAGEYHIRWNNDCETGSRFRTLWYKFDDRGAYGHSEIDSSVIFSFGADPLRERSPRYAHAFITRRGDLSSPPLRRVTMQLGHDQVPRPLRFLSFGDSLHDELIEGWLPKGDNPAALDVAFPDDHAFWEHGAPGLYLVRLTTIDPAAAIPRRCVAEKRTLEAIVGAATLSEPEQLQRLVRPFKNAMLCALEADVRWLRGLLEASMNIEVRRKEGDVWALTESTEAVALLNPLAHGHKGLPRATTLHAKEGDLAAVQAELALQRQADVKAARLAWSSRLPDFEKALEARLTVTKEEGCDAVALANEELRNATGAHEMALDKGNSAQVTRADNNRKIAADNLSMSRTYWEERTRWLRECNEYLRSILPRERIIALMRVQKF